METPAEFSDKSPAAMHDDAVLRAIAEGVEAETADRFFSSRARHLALALEVQYAFVSHLSDDGTRFKILALWERDHFGPNLEIPLTGTPCESVLHGESAHYSTDLCARFPDDQYRWFLVQYRPVHDEHGKLVRWYATGTDIDDQKQVELRLADQNAYLLDELRTEQNFGDLVGGSSGLRKVMRQVQLVAPTDATVLITGESGTGKELIARAIHEEGARSGRPLIKLNCSAVPEGLFESEFFGHVKGAFTGALKDKPGRFELADGGTLFLDEIGEVPLAKQAKLLRVLQEQELERVGDTRTRKLNVRVVAASNRDLKKEVEEGRFREDLFYRLGVFPIEVPPLRERRDDIAPLVAHFVRQSARRMNRPEPQMSKSALDQLATYRWPGNVRELQNTVERAIILWREGPLTFDLPASRPLEHIVEQPNSDVKVRLPTREEVKRLEREAIINALKQTNGKVSGPGGAARLLGLQPSTLASRISSLGIKRGT
jgi:transcriptional regulator with GAF, ATPase, and Fis domain